MPVSTNDEELRRVLRLGDRFLDLQVDSMPAPKWRDRLGLRRWPWACPFCFAPLSKPVCIDPPGYRGCRRPLPEEVPWGRFREAHVAICGPTPWKVLAVLALGWQALTNAEGGWLGQPCWELTRLEHGLLRDRLRTDPYRLRDTHGDHRYTICRSGIFRLKRAVRSGVLGKLGRAPRGLAQFHNMPVRWFDSDERLSVYGMHLLYDNALVFVVDLENARGLERGPLLHGPMWSRVVRHCERWGQNPWNARFAGRVAIAVPASRGSSPATSQEAEQLVRQEDPWFWGLLEHTAGGPVQYFGGPLSPYGPTPSWIVDLVNFVLG